MKFSFSFYEIFFFLLQLVYCHGKWKCFFYKHVSITVVCLRVYCSSKNIFYIFYSIGYSKQWISKVFSKKQLINRCLINEDCCNNRMYIILSCPFNRLSSYLGHWHNCFKGQTSKSLSFGSGSARGEDKSETPVNAGPDPCLPELCDKVWVKS